MKKAILLGFYLLLTWQLSANKVDSLLSTLSVETTKSDRIRTLHEICTYFNEVHIKTDSILKYANLVFPLTESFGDEHLHGKSLLYRGAGHMKADSAILFNDLKAAIPILVKHDDIHNVGMCYDIMADYRSHDAEFPEARKILNECISTIQGMPSFSEKEHSATISRMRGSEATNYLKEGNLMKSLEASLQAEKYAIISKDSFRLLKSFLNLSTVYGDLGSHERDYGTSTDRSKYRAMGLDYMNRAFDLSRNIGQLYTMGVTAYNLAVFYSLEKNFKRSDSLIQFALDTSRKYNFATIYLECNRLRADNYFDLGKLDSALICVNIAEDYSRRMRSKFYLARSLFLKSTILIEKGELKKGESLLDEHGKMIKDIGSLHMEKKQHQLLSRLREKQGRYKESLDEYIMYNDLKDSIIHEENYKEIEDLKTRYATELKEFQINELKQENEIQDLNIKRKNYLLWLLIGGGLGLGGILYFVFQRRTLLAKKEALESKQRLLRTQLNPHFLFNSLNSIQQFVYQKKDPQLIANHLAKFSRLTRRILQYSQDDYISLSDEVDFLKDYMDLQQIRFDIPFVYQIEIDEDLDDEEVLIPPMFTQPFLENSIEHGILQKQEKGEIHIQISKEGENLKIILKDNGVGREMAAFRKRNESHRSMATKITLDRLKVLEQKLRKKANLVINDIVNPDNKVTGTEVTLYLPLQYG